jgi:hypothetical protein
MINTSFPGVHNWPEASQFAGDAVGFLQHPHRHTFHIKAEMEVSSSDREIEFFILKKKVNDIIEKLYDCPLNGVAYELGRRSCEQIAEEIIKELRVDFNYKGTIMIEVWEDNEVGAKVSSEYIIND